jgi:hypothetical protein
LLLLDAHETVAAIEAAARILRLGIDNVATAATRYAGGYTRRIASRLLEATHDRPKPDADRDRLDMRGQHHGDGRFAAVLLTTARPVRDRTRSKLMTSSRIHPMTEPDTQCARAAALNLHGLLAHWSEVAAEAWVTPLLGWEEQEHARRGLERRPRSAHIGRFKPLCDFDWSWPKRCDRAVVDALMTLEFLKNATMPWAAPISRLDRA